MALLWGSRCRALPARRNRERIYPGCGAADRKGIVAGWGIGVKRREECWGRVGTACRRVSLPEVDVAGQTPVTAPHGWPPQVTVQNDRKAHVCPQPLPAAGAGCWGARRPGAATSMQGWLPPPATANRNGKLSLSACGTSVQTTPQILFFPCSQKNVNFFKQNPNFSSKAKKKKIAEENRKQPKLLICGKAQQSSNSTAVQPWGRLGDLLLLLSASCWDVGPFSPPEEDTASSCPAGALWGWGGSAGRSPQLGQGPKAMRRPRAAAGDERRPGRLACDRASPGSGRQRVRPQAAAGRAPRSPALIYGGLSGAAGCDKSL